LPATGGDSSAFSTTMHLKHPRQVITAAADRRISPVQRPGCILPLRTDRRGVDPGRMSGPPRRPAPRPRNAHRHQRHQLDHRLDRDGGDDAVVLLFGVQVAGAEQDGEQRQPRRHPDRRLPWPRAAPTLRAWRWQRRRRTAPPTAAAARYRASPPPRDQRHDHAQQCSTCHSATRSGRRSRSPGVAARSDQLAQHPPPADEDQRRAEVDRQELQPRARRIADRAVKRPGGAIDRQRQRVDQRASAASPAAPRARRSTRKATANRKIT
jgi:hypothetical protein